VIDCLVRLVGPTQENLAEQRSSCSKNQFGAKKAMKTITLYIISALLLCGVGVGFASPTPSPTPRKPPPRKPAKKVDESEKPPFIGMTKAQAQDRYGEPKKRTVTDDGEQWTYILNMGEFIGKHMIPFFFSEQQLRYGVLIFGPNGKVKKFRWDTDTDR
jgi:hypothetical protein